MARTECYEFATGIDHRTVVLINHAAGTTSIYSGIGSKIKHKIVDVATGIKLTIDLLGMFPVVSESTS